MRVPVLSVYDANGNKIAIPAIKGNKGAQGVKGDKGDKGEKGDKGDPGSLVIKGYFNSLTELCETITFPTAGDTYGVGTQAPYHIYIYDPADACWVDNGTIQGAKGDKGDRGEKGDTGADGATGKGISDIAKINTVGKLDTYRISFSDGTSSQFTVTNGSDGTKGDKGDRGIQGIQGVQGIQGQKGDKGDTGVGISYIRLDENYMLHFDMSDGTTSFLTRSVRGERGPLPVKGTDYWTAADKDEIVADVVEELAQGASLSLVVVNGLEEPAEPSENMIWVKSETAVPKWSVSSQRPETGLVNGQVWLREMYMPLCEITPSGSNVSFSIAQCWQYVDGEWIWQDCEVYTDGAWRGIGVYLYKSGTGWNGNFGGYNRGAWSENTTHEYFQSSGTTSGSELRNSTPISAGVFRYVFIDIDPNASSNNFLYISRTSSSSGQITKDTYTGERGTYRLSLNNVTEDFYLLASGGASGGKIYNIWFC